MIRYDHLLAPCDKIEETASIGRHWPGAIPSLPPGTGSPDEMIRRTRIRRFVPAYRAPKSEFAWPARQPATAIASFAPQCGRRTSIPPTRGSDAAPFSGPIQSSL